MDTNLLPHQIALNKAKIALMSKPDSAFFTTICFSLKHVWDDTIPTACTNGKQIRFSPQFFMSLTKDEQVFLLLHEAMHCAYLHMDRVETRDRKKWNHAADYVINLQLVERGFKMPSCGLLDRKYAGMSTEEVYKILPSPPEDQPTPGMGDDLEEPGESSEQLQQDIQDILVRASVQSKMSNDKVGTIPGEIQIFLDNLLDPKLPWHRILQKYLQTFAKNDYTFKKPNRRFFPKWHLPSLHSESLMEIAVAVDTSGSVTDEDFKAFISEVHSILRMMKPEKLTLIQFDTSIKSVHPIKSVSELMKVQFSGRGGTDILPVVQWANINKPQLLLVFTDGEFKFYNEQAKSETLWLIHNNPHFKAPWGKVIHYEV